MAYTKLFLSDILTTKFTDIGRMNDHLRKSDLDRALVILSPIELWKLMVKNPTNLKDSLIFPFKNSFLSYLFFVYLGRWKSRKLREMFLLVLISLNQACFRIYFELESSSGLKKCDEEIRSEYHSQIYIQELGRPKSTLETTRIT